MMRRFVLLSLVFLASINSIAATVIDVNETSIDLALNESERLIVGDVLTLSEGCNAKVVSSSGRKASAALAECKDPSKVVLGLVTMPLEIKKDQQAIKVDGASSAPEVPITDKESYFSLGLGLSLNPKMKMDFNYFSGTLALKGNAEISFDSAILISGEWSQFKKYAWNHGVLISYANMKLDKATISFAGSTTSGIVSNSDLNILTAAYAGKLRWNLFYLPVYAGMSNGTLNSQDQLLKSITTGVFVAAGAGYVINNTLNFEATINVHTTYSAGGTYAASGGTFTLVPEVGSLSYLQLGLKAIF